MAAAMPQITIPSGMALEYETYGTSGDPPVLMVMGFGSQLVSWPRDFCRQLAAGGRFVIGFDNRDCGLSARLDGRSTRELSKPWSSGLPCLETSSKPGRSRPTR